MAGDKGKSAHDLDRIIVRLPDGMREKIQALADTNGRSMTAEVVAALEGHLSRADRIGELEAFVEKHRHEIEAISKIHAEARVAQNTADTAMLTAREESRTFWRVSDALTAGLNEVERRLGLETTFISELYEEGPKPPAPPAEG